MADATDTVLIKRYAGSRLYDTMAARYVTADDIAAMARFGLAVTVREAAGGRDITVAFVAKKFMS
jgi:polyhydroxyalkanoate synthesis regulator protein